MYRCPARNPVPAQREHLGGEGHRSPLHAGPIYMVPLSLCSKKGLHSQGTQGSFTGRKKVLDPSRGTHTWLLSFDLGRLGTKDCYVPERRSQGTDPLWLESLHLDFCVLSSSMGQAVGGQLRAWSHVSF